MSWFMAAALRWTHERIQQHSSLFHLAGWGLPATQTIAVLVLQDVDADELTGKVLYQILQCMCRTIFAKSERHYILVDSSK